MRYTGLWWIGVCIGALTVCSVSAQPSAFGLGGDVPAPKQAPAKEKKPEEAEPPADPVEAALQTLDLKGRIAQLMVCAMQGEVGPSGEDTSFLKSYTPGGVVIRQALAPGIVEQYVKLVRAIEAGTKLPLLVGADLYELTEPHRLARSTFPQVPSLLAVSAAGADSAGRFGDLLASYAHGLGLNFILGPSLELAPELEEAPGTLNTLGSDPVFAASVGQAIMDAFAAQSILCVPLGFPGGGNNRAGNTPAVLLTPEPLLLTHDLLPYARVLENGVKMINVGNTLVPTLDDLSRPASLSREVMTMLLRDKMRFEGVIVAGPLDSEDIVRTYDQADAALQALQAGADMVYWRGGDDTVIRVVERLAWAVEDGRLSESVINAALRRVMALKTKYTGREAGAEITRPYRAAKKDRSLTDQAYEIERRSITVVQNRGQVLPLGGKDSLPIVLVGTVDMSDFKEDILKYTRDVVRYNILTAKHFGDIEDFEVERVIKNFENYRTAVCVFTDAPRAQGQARLVQALKKAGKTVVAVLIGYPTHVPKLAAADAVVLGYCDPAACRQTLRAVADVIMGAGPVRFVDPEGEVIFRVKEKRVFDVMEVARVPYGHLPVGVSPEYPSGLSIPYDASQSVKKAVWDFGTGKKIKKKRVEYAFEKPGRYPVTLKVKDRKGQFYTHAFPINVR